jgi:hypothetical protein
VSSYEYASTECARDCGPYEVKNAGQETQTHAGKVKYMRQETQTHAQALNFGEFSGSDKAKEATKNYQFNTFAYEGRDPWHTRYDFKRIASNFHFQPDFLLLLLRLPLQCLHIHSSFVLSQCSRSTTDM